MRTYTFQMICPECGHHYALTLGKYINEFERCPKCGYTSDFYDFCYREKVTIPYTPEYRKVYAYYRDASILDSMIYKLPVELKRTNLILNWGINN